MRKFIFCLILLFAFPAYAQIGYAPTRVTEIDLSPDCAVSSILFTNGTVTCNADGTATVVVSGGGSSTFLGLTDTPSSYSGAGGYFVKVNAGANALEFAASSVLPHPLLSATHTDSTTGTVVRGDVITGQGASPTWTRLGKGSSGAVLAAGATDVAWTTYLLSGTTGQTYTFPSTSKTLAASDATNLAVGSDARGDILIRGASAYGRLAVGTSGSVLTNNGTDPAWSTFFFSGTGAATYTFPGATATIARTDAGQTFTGVQSMTSAALTTPVVTTDIHAASAGGATVGTAALPFSSVYIGDAATNNIQLTGTAASAKVVTLPGQTGTVTVGPTTTTAGQAFIGTATAGLGAWTTGTLTLGTNLTTNTGAVTLTGDASGSTLVLGAGSNTLGTAAYTAATAYAPAAGATSIVTVGTIGTGEWNATVIPIAKGGTGLTAGLTQYAVVLGGGAAAGNSEVSGLGTSGQVLTSAGAGAPPTWSSLAGSGDVVGPAGNSAASTVVLFDGTSGKLIKEGLLIFTGPTSTAKSYALPDANATILTSAAAVTVNQGGTGITNGTQYGIPYFATTNTIASSAAGTTAQVLHGNGAGAPAWGAVTGVDISLTSEAAGDVMYFDGTDWVRLAKDEGKYLKSGAAAVSWDSPSGAGDVTGGATSVDGELAAYNGTGGKTLKQSFAKFSGPVATLRTYTVPDADATILTSAAAVTVNQGGTGLTNGTSGGIVYFSATNAMTSSALLAANGVMIGGGAGASPSTITASTTTTNVLFATTGTPAFRDVALTDISTALSTWTGAASITTVGTIASGVWSGTTIAVNKGGTGAATLTGYLVGNGTNAVTATAITDGGIPYGGAAGTLAELAFDGTATRYLANTGADSSPAWAQVNLANGVTGTLPVGNGGTGLTTGTEGGIVWFTTTSALASSALLAQYGIMIGGGVDAAPSTLALGTAGQIMTSGGAGATPAWTTATYPAVATGTGTILRANGINWIASTTTLSDSYAVGDLLHVSGANAVTGLADAAVGNVLISGGVGVVPSWGKVAMTTHTSAGNWKVFYSNGSGALVELALGADGTYLRANGAAAAPTFDTPGGAGDVASVGDCTGGACNDGTSDGGTYLGLYHASGNTFMVNNAGTLDVVTTSGGGTYANLKAATITASAADGSNKLVITNNTAIAGADQNAIYPEANVWKVTQGGAATEYALVLSNEANQITMGAMGTAGRIPYVSASNTLAASGAMTQYGVMLGGGTGSPTVAVDVSNPTYPLFANTGAAPSFRAIAAADLPVVTASKGGTGVANNNANTITFAGGNYSFTLTLAANSTLTMPTAGTLSVNNGTDSAGYIQFAEDGDNGTDKVTLSAPAALAGTVVVNLPSAAGTLALTDGSNMALASQAQGDILYAATASTLARLGAGTAGQVLKTGGAAANPAWSTVVLTESTNTFNWTNGTAVLDIAAGATLNIDTNLTVQTGAVTITGNAAGSTLTLPAALNLAGTLTDGNLCTYTTSGTIINCNTATSTFQAASAALASIAGLSEADVSILEMTADNTYAVVTSGGNNYILGSNSGNTALEFKQPTGSGLPVLGTSPTFTTSLVTPQVDFGTTGGRLSAAGGTFTLAGLGNTYNENLTFDMEPATDTQTVTIASGTGVTKLDFSALNLVTTGTIQGGINVITDADAHTITAAEAYGTLGIATGAGTWDLPTAVQGMSFCLMDSGTAHDLILDVQAGDDIQLKGTEQANGVGITNAAGSTTGDFICVVAISAGHWVTMGMSGTWASQ